MSACVHHWHFLLFWHVIRHPSHKKKRCCRCRRVYCEECMTPRRTCRDRLRPTAMYSPTLEELAQYDHYQDQQTVQQVEREG